MCTSWEDCCSLGAGGLSPLSCPGTVGPSSLQDLHCSVTSTASQDSCAKWTSLLELCIRCVQFSCLINPCNQSGSHSKYGSKLKMEEDLLCVDFALEINWDLRFSCHFKKKSVFAIKKFGVPPRVPHKSCWVLFFKQVSGMVWGLSHLI